MTGDSPSISYEDIVFVNPPLKAELNAQTLAAIIVLFVPRFRAPEWSTIRAFFFVFMGSSAFYPIIYATYLYGFERMNHEAGASFYLLAALLYLAGAVIYAVSALATRPLFPHWTISIGAVLMRVSFDGRRNNGLDNSISGDTPIKSFIRSSYWD